MLWGFCFLIEPLRCLGQLFKWHIGKNKSQNKKVTTRVLTVIKLVSKKKKKTTIYYQVLDTLMKVTQLLQVTQVNNFIQVDYQS